KFGHFLATARENRLPHRKTVVISNRGVGKFMKKSSFLSGTTYELPATRYSIFSCPRYFGSFRISGGRTVA
ncbi:MAG: hypothetical protein PHH11_12015, partial [Methylomonas sp.]|nr:hypothetical protein [Methylomonas sp.]